jgi:hypothetical protein
MTRVYGSVRPNDSRCLHCLLTYSIALWAKQHAPQEAGVPILDISEVIGKMAEVVGDFVYKSPDPALRAQFERYAFECLSAAFESKRTGRPVAVSVDALSRDH